MKDNWNNEENFLHSIPCQFIEKLLKLNFCDEIIIYGKEELYERNMTNEVYLYLQDYFIFGDDGGDEVYLAKIDSTKEEIFKSDIGDLSISGLKKIADNLDDFYEKIMSYEENDEKNDNVFTLKWNCFEGGELKELVSIKKILELDISINELLKMSKQLPYSLMENLSDIHAKYYYNALGELQRYFEIV